MPSLKQITCSVEFGSSNTALKEYHRRYHDGIVECFICVPPSDVPFSIHVTSSGYIAPGMAVFVFMDGAYHCNRNRNNLREPSSNAHPKTYEIDFRMRQKEEKSSRTGFVGRDWSFAELNTANADSEEPMDSRFLTNVGTIEIVILRCKAKRDDRLDRTSLHLANESTARASALPAPVAQPKPSESEASTSVKASEASLGGLFGLFDGAYDERRGHSFASLREQQAVSMDQTDGLYDRPHYDEQRRSRWDDRSHYQSHPQRDHIRDHGNRGRSPRRYQSPERSHPRSEWSDDGNASEYSLRTHADRNRYSGHSTSPRDTQDRRGRRASPHRLSSRRRHLYNGHGGREEMRRQYQESDLEPRNRTRYRSPADRRHRHSQQDESAFGRDSFRSGAESRNHNDSYHHLNVGQLFNRSYPHPVLPLGKPFTSQHDSDQDSAEMGRIRGENSAMYTALMETGSRLLQMNQEIHELELRCKLASDDKRKLEEEVSELRAKRATKNAEQKKRMSEWQGVNMEVRRRDQHLRDHYGGRPRPDFYLPFLPYHPADFRPAGRSSSYHPPMPGRWLNDELTGSAAAEGVTSHVHWANNDTPHGGTDAAVEKKDDTEAKKHEETTEDTKPETPNETHGWPTNSNEDNWANNDTGGNDTANGGNEWADAADFSGAGGPGDNNNNGGDEWVITENKDGGIKEWNNSGDADGAGNTWESNDTSKQGEGNKNSDSKESQSKSTPGSSHRSHKSSVRSSTTASTIRPPPMKSYWTEWQTKTTSPPDPSPRNARDPYHCTPRPLPAGRPSDAHVTHGIQAGKGAAYTHDTHQPEYMDTLSNPYAVFSFHYRSKEALEKILKREIEAVNTTAAEAEERKTRFTKEELIEDRVGGEEMTRGIKGQSEERKEDKEKEEKGKKCEKGAGAGKGGSQKSWGGGGVWGSESVSKKSETKKSETKTSEKKKAESVKSGGWAQAPESSADQNKSNSNDNDNSGGDGWNAAGGGETTGGGGNW